MFWMIYIIIYWVSISTLAFWLRIKDIDVMKELGVWVYRDNFNKGDIVTIPIQCLIDVNKGGN